MPIRPFRFAVVFVALSACSRAEVDAAMTDPNAFACRQRAIALHGVPFDRTAAWRTGEAVYEITAADRTYRCTLDENRMIAGYDPIG